MSNVICASGECVACNNCINICPVHCIEYSKDSSDTTFAVIDNDRCLKCGLCRKACPQNVTQIRNAPRTCYAAWSNNEMIRTNSASGGIATELYSLFIKKHARCVGVVLSKDYCATYKIADSENDIQQFQNSKYVYSNTQSTYKDIAESLKKGETVFMVGLPCHIAALKQFVKVLGIKEDNLFTADLVCHGVCPSDYLITHITSICQQKNVIADGAYFRDPMYGTDRFVFSLLNNGKRFYSKKVHFDDVYQEGYHSGITYRTNCYNCHYANLERCSDLTLADFSYVGYKKECKYSNKKVSCILCNTEKGKEIIDGLMSSRKCFIEERPIEEEIEYEERLHSPTPITESRRIFLREYEVGRDFNVAVNIALKKRIHENRMDHYFHFKFFIRAFNYIKRTIVKRCS